MSLFAYLGILLTAVTLFGAVSIRILKLPITIGVMALSLVSSIFLLCAQSQHPELTQYAINFVKSVNWNSFVMQGVLGPLLFFGALHVPLDGLRKFKYTITALATVSVLISTVAIGFGAHWVLNLLGFDVSIWWTLAFGAILSPSDPIAVLALLKKAGVPKDLENKIALESLANDGPSVVAYMTLAGIAVGASAGISINSVVSSLITEVVGALVYGGIVGFIAVNVLRFVAQSPILVFSLLGSVATAGYTGAFMVHVSAPLAAAVMGIVVGNWGLNVYLTDEQKHSTHEMVEIADAHLNLVLFLVIGMELLALSISWSYFGAGLIMIPVILLARFISVGAPILALRRIEPIADHAVKVMTWGGLRGGISIAMAVSTPEFVGRDVLTSVVYLCVVFSLLVQALTLPAFIKMLKLQDPSIVRTDS